MRIVKIIGLGLLGLLVLAIIAIAGLPWVPVAKDQFGSEKYQTWLADNKQTIDLAGSQAIVPPTQLADAEFIMLSEIHGFADVQRLDLALLRGLNAQHGVRSYLAELSPAQAMAFNEMVSGGSDQYAREVFDRWGDQSTQWGNREFFAKLQAMAADNEARPEDRRVYFIGADKEGDADWAAKVVAELSGDGDPAFGSLGGVQAINRDLATAEMERDTSGSRYDSILPNIASVRAIDGANEETFYGLWGLFHGSKAPVNGSDPLSLRLNADDGAFAGKVLTIGTLAIDWSFNMMPTQALPSFWHGDAGQAYSVVPLSYDQTYMARLRGVGDVMDAMGEDRAALFRIGGEGTPYADGPRLSDASGIFAMMQPFEYGGPAAEVNDFLLVLRGSPALTPWKGEVHDVTGGDAPAPLGKGAFGTGAAR